VIRKIVSVALWPLLLAVSLSTQAQQPTKIAWIGYLTGAGSSPNKAFVEGLRELGYVQEYWFCLSDNRG
jgi:hypothetical protein